MVFWAKSLIIMYGIRFGGGRVEILTFIIVNGVITPPYFMSELNVKLYRKGGKTC